LFLVWNILYYNYLSSWFSLSKKRKKITSRTQCNKYSRKYSNDASFTLSSMAPRSVRFGVRSRQLSNVGQSLDRWPKIYYLDFLRASEDTLSRWSRLHMQSLAPTNPQWARVVGYGPLFLCVIRKTCAPQWGH
jgi:hypothetical protein